MSKGMVYPVQYGSSLQDSTLERKVEVTFNGKSSPVDLKFEPYQSVLLNIDESGNIKFEDIRFVPKRPVKE